MNASVILVLVQKFHRELCLLLLVLFGLACGQLAATLVGTMLRPSTPFEQTSHPAAHTSRQQISDHDLNRILQQNIFDPAARGRNSTAIKSAQTDKPAKSPTRKDLTLIGTLVAGTDSTALIKTGKKIKIFHMGEQLPGGGQIDEIRRNLVTIRNRDGSTTDLPLHKETLDKNRPTPSPATSTAIRPAGQNRWTVPRATADAARTNIAEQLRLAQMEPRIINGSTDGFLVRKLYAKSLLTKMGIKRGDVILRVNNMSLNSPEKALQILQQLREARQLTVDLERRGKPMTFSYEIN